MKNFTQPGDHHLVYLCSEEEHNAQKKDRERQEGRGKKESPEEGGKTSLDSERDCAAFSCSHRNRMSQPAREIFSSNSTSAEEKGWEQNSICNFVPTEPLLEVRRGSGRLRTRLPGAERGRGGEAQQSLPGSNKVSRIF